MKIAKVYKRKILDSMSKKKLKCMQTVVEDYLSLVELNSNAEDAEDDRDSSVFPYVLTGRDTITDTKPNSSQTSRPTKHYV